MEWHQDGYMVSDDRRRVDREVVHGFLTESYWAQGIAHGLYARFGFTPPRHPSL